ncbi:phage tail tape measure C-terminal domain-containing protein [Comamonas thiooxydans]|uniref:phage tail tape measure C-terminal domain-containing protein n=1 Tax=Comamonas thiooxydans TaxID=363952 RepID=UPI00057ADD44|nr:phage tail tape measure C-terminal domain-containing protein [Comamonas thiooxydans]
MARQLGTLTIDLIAKIGGFVKGMTDAERAADRKTRDIERKLKAGAEAVEKAWTGIGVVLTATLAGISVGSVFSKVITESRNAEQEQALLAAALKSTGNQAGYSQDRLNEMADAMESVTTISAGDFNQAQTVLLGFTNIVGEQLPKALKIAADYSIRTGADMKSAAETMGRALDVPSAGMSSLQKQGFKFSESQIEAAKQLEETGRIAEAQQIVFDALEETYGGAAEAARDTFGGALDGLRNTLNGVLTGDEGSLAEAKKAVNELSETLSSQSTKDAFAQLTKWVFDLASALVTATTHFINFGKFVGETFAKAIHGSADPIERLGESIKDAQVELAALNKELARPQKFAAGSGYDSREELIKRRDALQKQVNAMQKSQQDFIRLANNPPPIAAPSTAPDMTPRTVGPVKLKDGDKKSSTGKTQAQKDQEAAEKFLQTLRDQAFKIEQKSAYEQLFYDIQSKGVKLSTEQLDSAIGLVTAIDMAKEAELTRAAAVERNNVLYEQQNRLIAKEQQLQLELLTYGMGDKSAAELREKISLMQQHQAELRKLQQDQASAVIGADTEKERQRIQAAFAERIRITQTAQQQELQLYEDFLQQKREREGNWLLGAQSGLATYLENARDMYSQAQGIASRAFTGMEDLLVNFVKTGKMDVRSLFASIGEEVLRMLIRMGIQMVANKLLGDTLQAAGVATSVAAGAATAAAWAPAAAMASLASFGANAAPASAGIASTVALSQGLAMIPGFDQGGYTGPGARLQIAGWVHAGEGVLNQDDMAALGGPAAFEAFRRGLHGMPGYANGGVVGAPRIATRADYAAQLAGSAPIVNVIEDASKAGQIEQTQNADGSYTTNVFVRNIRNGGEEALALETTYGLTRRGR